MTESPVETLEKDIVLQLFWTEGLTSFGHMMKRADSLEKTLMLGKIEGRRRRG